MSTNMKTTVRRVSALQKLRQLEEFVTVGTFDEDVEALGAVGSDGGFHLFDIVELAEGAGDVAEVVAHEPHVIVAGRLQTIH